MSDLYRQLPAIHAVLADPRVAELPHDAAVSAARAVLDEVRAEIAGGTLTELPDIESRVIAEVEALLAVKTARVVNATGVIVHTNLGRAPWHPLAVRAAAEAASGYCQLEIDLESGARGGRLDGVRRLLRHLTGAEDALVVNNCAAAVLLALTAIARDHEVIVSRGELVEIGGSFRVPDVVSSGGAMLVGVGTTNRTRIGDYAAAIGPMTAVLLRVHPSNFRVVGFTERPVRADLVALADAHGLALVEDLGSGSLDGAHGEPSVRDAIADGVHLAMFSGDKLLGGPQAGIVVGRAGWVARLRKHPLYRALRVDKVILAGLEATLACHAAGRRVPVEEMLDASPAELSARTAALLEALQAMGVPAHRIDSEAVTGGGTLPGKVFHGDAVGIEAPDLDGVARRLRLGDPPVIARIDAGHLALDVRTLVDSDVPVVARQVAAALAGG